MRVIAYDPFISPEAAEKLGITLASFDDLLKNADFISVHTPMTKETRGIINAAAFAKMKKGVFIINCARGGIISEKDLLDALNSGQVAGAALDVFEEEPTKNKELVGHANVICTPHLGASTDEAQINVAIAVAEQVADYLTKGEIRNAVNFPSVSGELLNIIQPYLELVEKLGQFQAQLVSGGIKEVLVEYSGEILNYNVAPLINSLMKGLLTPILKENVNYINAPSWPRNGASRWWNRKQRGSGLYEHDFRDGQDPERNELYRGRPFRPAGPGSSGSTSSPWTPSPRATCWWSTTTTGPA